MRRLITAGLQVVVVALANLGVLRSRMTLWREVVELGGLALIVAGIAAIWTVPVGMIAAGVCCVVYANHGGAS